MIALTAGIAVNWSTIKSMFGSGVVITAIVIVAIAGVIRLLLGRILSRGSTEIPTTTGLVSIFRFGSLRLIIIGSQPHGDPPPSAPRSPSH